MCIRDSLYALPLNGVPFLGAPFNCYNGIPTTSAGHDWDDDASATPGILGRPVPFAEIVDGLSNTLLVSETVQGQGSDLRGFTWWGSVSGFVTYMSPNSSEPDVLTGGNCESLVNGNPPCTTMSTLTRPRVMAARSRHPGGVNAAFADGHVAFIKDAISTTVWSALSTTMGGEVINDSDL